MIKNGKYTKWCRFWTIEFLSEGEFVMKFCWSKFWEFHWFINKPMISLDHALVKLSRQKNRYSDYK
jgi:hypothetical protein